jgi:hypothetical protein
MNGHVRRVLERHRCRPLVQERYKDPTHLGMLTILRALRLGDFVWSEPRWRGVIDREKVLGPTIQSGRTNPRTQPMESPSRYGVSSITRSEGHRKQARPSREKIDARI